MNNIQSACILIKYEVKEMQYPRKHDIKIKSDICHEVIQPNPKITYLEDILLTNH